MLLCIYGKLILPDRAPKCGPYENVGSRGKASTIRQQNFSKMPPMKPFGIGINTLYDTHYIIGSANWSTPYPDMVTRFQSIISGRDKMAVKKRRSKRKP